MQEQVITKGLDEIFQMESLQYFLGVVACYGNVNTLSLNRESLICSSDVPGAGLFRMDQSLCEGMNRAGASAMSCLLGNV